MRTLLGIDVGTSATRAVLIRTDGSLVGAAARPHRVHEPSPGRAEHDSEAAWWCEIVEVLRELTERHGLAIAGLEGIGISAIGASIVPVDEDGRALRPAILYGIDSRAMAQARALEDSLGYDFVLERTGRELSTQSVGPKILWVREHEPATAARTQRFLPPTAFIGERLCGRAAIDPHTALAIHPLFRADRMTWDEEVVRHVCRLDQLPEVVPAGTPLGGLRAEVARATGLPAGLPVCCGTADVLAEALACGASRPGDTVVMYGSTLFVIHITDGFRPQPPFWASVYPLGGLSCLTTGTSTAGASAQWLLDVLGVVTGEARTALLHEAEKVEAAHDGLVFLPYLRGERAPIFEPQARGVFFGLSATHSAPHLYRAILEAIGFSLRHVLDEMGLVSHRTFATGGGSELDLAVRLAVNASAKPQLRPRHGRSAGYGSAMLAGIGLGVLALSDLDANFFGGFDLVEPKPDGADVEAAYRLYRRVGDACRPLFAGVPIGKTVS